MSDLRLEDQFGGAVRALQIIVIALASGCLTFAAIAVFLNLENGPAAAAAGPPMITYLALAAIVPAAIAFVIARAVLNGQARRSALAIIDQMPDDSSGVRSPDDLLQSSEVVRVLLQHFQTRLIVGAAILEGVAFFLLVSYLLEGNPVALGAGIVLALGITLLFPTRSRVAAWILEQVESIRNQQQFSR